MRGDGLHPVCSWPQFPLLYNEGIALGLYKAIKLINNSPGLNHTEKEEGLGWPGLCWGPCPKTPLSGSPFPAREELGARASGQPAVSWQRSQSSCPNQLLEDGRL